MPHKFNADRRDKIPKQKHRVTNWAEYNEGLRRRGDLTVWISDEALGMWSAARRTTRGGRPRYSDLAIELCLTLGMVFKQPLRQTQGFMSDIAGILGVEIAVPEIPSSFDNCRMAMLFGGSNRFSTAAFRAGEYPMSSSYPAHLKIRDK
jgi:hypothetical protein